MKGGETQMKITTLSLVVGVVVGALGLLGLISGDGRIMGEMNINLFLDIARIGLGALLIYAGTRSVELSRTAFSIFGVAYLGMFLLGLISPTMFGLLPDGIGLIDQVLHLGGGIAGVFLGLMAGNKHRAAI